MFTRTLSIFTLISLALPVVAFAVTFTDVYPDHPFSVEILTLADSGIVKGNPDGTFKPANTVNRAEMLTMLYRAAGKTPAAPSKTCFKDSGVMDWYSAVVCDAAKNGYVGGYPDGSFKPGNPVNRVESLKMIHTVLGLTVNANASTSPLTAYSDVSLSAWYTPYMISAFDYGILPIVGQEPPLFKPESALTRAEAAAYIFNALGLTASTASSSAASTVTSTPAGSSASQKSTANAPIILDVDFPFSDDGNFSGTTSKVYKFTLKSPVTGSITIDTDVGDTVQCRLYKLDSVTSFALEYYVGSMVDNRCWMRVALAAGNYQLEVLPGTKNAFFELHSKLVSGDGNDGFSQAVTLLKSSPKTGYIEDEDYGEFYTFTLTQQQKLTVSVSNGTDITCLIFPMADVDLFGFSGPVCDAQYDFPAGTYVVGVTRRNEVEGKVSFSIRYESEIISLHARNEE